MGTFLDVAVGVLLVAVAVTVALWLVFNVRARKLDRRVGSFRCWMRPDSQSGWTSGIAQYETQTLSWYRLIALSSHPALSLVRRGMEVSAPVRRATDGSIVEVRVTSGDQRCEFAIQPATYNGLVSWVESGPPHS